MWSHSPGLTGDLGRLGLAPPTPGEAQQHFHQASWGTGSASLRCLHPQTNQEEQRSSNSAKDWDHGKTWLIRPSSRQTQRKEALPGQPGSGILALRCSRSTAGLTGTYGQKPAPR